IRPRTVSRRWPRKPIRSKPRIRSTPRSSSAAHSLDLSRRTLLWGSGPFNPKSGPQAHKSWRSKKTDSVLGPGRGDLQHEALQGKRRVRAAALDLNIGFGRVGNRSFERRDAPGACLFAKGPEFERRYTGVLGQLAVAHAGGRRFQRGQRSQRRGDRAEDQDFGHII